MLEIGLFYQDEQEKPTKPMIIVRVIVAILMVMIFIFGIIKGFDFALVKWIFILAGVNSIFDGIAKYLQGNYSKAYLIEFVFALFWFALAFIGI
ncbi:hypothetical protein ACUL41_06210 [Virgibacillus natechei]